MLADALTKRSTTARRTYELFVKGGQRWRLIFDPKFQSEKRRTRAGMARLLNGDEEASEKDADAMYVEYWNEAGVYELVQLILEDGWIKMPDTTSIKGFEERCRERIQAEYQEDAEQGADPGLLGAVASREAEALVRSVHEEAAEGAHPVTLPSERDTIQV